MEKQGGESETTEALAIEGAVEPLVAGQIVLGKYRIVGRLGVGGMAEVYEATHLQLGSTVALKLPLGRAGSSRGAKMAARLLREAQVGASLDPERVVRVFDVGVLEDGTPIIVLERLDGESMAERLARVERVSVTTAIGWVRQACVGLSEAHQRGIVHRDVKPSNLFLESKRDGGERLRILDFGIASIRAAAEGAADSGTHTDSRGPIGSPPYMSPEQIRDSNDVDARADVWALGVTLFELIAGRRPFSGIGSALVASILSDPIPKLASLGVSVDPDLESLITSCLSRDPALRPSDAADLGTRLDGLANGTPIPLPRSPARQTRWRAVGAVALAVAGIASVIAWASSTRNHATSSASVLAPLPATTEVTTPPVGAPEPSTTIASAQPILATPTSSPATAPVSITVSKSAVKEKSAKEMGAPPAASASSAAQAHSVLDDREF